MTIKVAINGLGRIGRCVARLLAERNNKNIELVAINGPAPIETHIHLLKYDSVHGTFPNVSKKDDATLNINGLEVPLYRERKPEDLPWEKLGVDIVLECSGKFKSKEDAQKHLNAGAKKVVISAPSPNPDATIVIGVNEKDYISEKNIISIGSCTTNCLAPIVKILNNAIGIEKGFVTTIHAYTNDQNLIDNSHNNLQRARGAALSMIPSSTGAAKALSLVIPEMKDKLDGVAVRVPTPNVSLVDLTFNAKKETSTETINSILENASSSALKNIISCTSEPLVSIDFNHTPQSATVDLNATKVVDKTFCRVAAWYDNEWGFSNRMLDIVELIHSYQ